MKRKVIILFSAAFVFFMTVLFIYYLVKGDTSRWQVAFGGILVSALPIGLLFVKKNPFNIPSIIGYYVFLFCTLYLGSIASFYLHYKWWDSSLHFYKGVYVGIIGVTLYKVLIHKEARKETSRWILFLFVFSLSISSSVLWEVYEFLGDLFFTETMQRGGNTDTMYDLLWCLVGGLPISIYSSIRESKI